MLGRVSTKTRLTKAELQQCLTNANVFREADAICCLPAWRAGTWEIALEGIRSDVNTKSGPKLTLTLRALHLEQDPTFLIIATFLRVS
jgi:hypothetical protein